MTGCSTAQTETADELIVEHVVRENILYMNKMTTSVPYEVHGVGVNDSS